MKISKYILLTIFSLTFAATVNAKEINVEALGVGEDYDWAVLNAVENAVRQTSDIYISKNVPEVKSITRETVVVKTEDGKVVSSAKTADLKGNISSELKTIEAHYKGKIKSYRVKSMEEKNSKVYVTIDAVVEVAEPEVVVEYKSPTIITKPEHTLAVMPFKGLKTYSCGKDKVALSAVNTNIINNLNKKISKTNKFSVVNRDDLFGYNSEMELTASDLTRSKDKSKLGNLATADYLIVGTINEFQSFTNTKTIDVTGESYSRNSAKIVVDYSIIETATMEIVFADTASAILNREGKPISCENILRDLTEQLSDEITHDAMKTIFPNYEYVVEKVLNTAETTEEPKVEHTTKKVTTTTTTQTREIIKLPQDN